MNKLLRTVAVILSVCLLFCIVPAAYAEDETPDDPVKSAAGHAIGDYDTWKDAYYHYLVESDFWLREQSDGNWKFCADPFGLPYYTDATDADGNFIPFMFALYDWDLDGIPELLAYDGIPGRGGSYYGFTFRDRQMVFLGVVGRGCYSLVAYRDEKYNVLFSMDDDGMYSEVQYACLDNNGKAEKKLLFTRKMNFMEDGNPDEFFIEEGPGHQELYEIYQANFDMDNLETRLEFGDKPGPDQWNDFLVNYSNAYVPPQAPAGQAKLPELNADDSWKQLYYDYIMGGQYLKYYDSTEDITGEKMYTDDFGCAYFVNEYWDIWFALYDMDRNGIPELITYSGYGDGAGGVAYAFTAENGTMRYLGDVGSREASLFCYDSDAYPGIFESGGHMGVFYTYYSYLENGKIQGKNVEEHEGWFDDNDHLVESDPVFTDEAALRDLYQNGTKYGIGERTIAQIREMGWNAFLLTAGKEPASGSGTGGNEGTAQVPETVPEETQPSAAVPMNRADWPGYSWDQTMHFQDLLFDSETYQGGWKETYLQVIRKFERGIRHHIRYYDSYATGNPGIILYDLTYDGIPEMLFISLADASYDPGAPESYFADLYIYSNDGSRTKCVLSIPDVYACAWDGAYYSLFFDKQTGIFYAQYADPLPWQAEYNVSSNFLRGTTYRFTTTDNDDENESHYYIDGNEVSAAEAEAVWIKPDSGMYEMLASTSYPETVSSMDYDAAVQFLTDSGSVPEIVPETPASGDVQPESPFADPLFYAKAKKETRIRESADKNSPLITKAAKGKEMAVIGKVTGADNMEWYKIQMFDGTIGYARNDFFAKTERPVGNNGAVYGKAIKKLATRSGPSPLYEDTGTYSVKGQYIKILCRQFDAIESAWWVKCEIPYHGEIRTLWAWYTRFDTSTLPLEMIPIGE